MTPCERSLPDSPEYRMCREMGFEEVRPGCFHGWVKNLDALPVAFQDKASRLGVNFTFFDPDAKNIPFHRSAEFMVIPERWRFHFLVRNPLVLRKLVRLAALAHQWNMQRQRRRSGGITLAERQEEEMLRLDRELQETYGISWLFVSLDGRAVDPPQLFLAPSFPDTPSPVFAGPSVRGRRAFKRVLAKRRKSLRVTPPRRQADSYYIKLLEVWDSREHFRGPMQGYVPDKAVTLEMATTVARTTKDAYYRAFRFIFGCDYEAAVWQQHLAAQWMQRRRWEWRRRGRGRRPSGQTEEQDIKRIAAFPIPPGIEHLLALLRDGVELPLALDQVPEYLKKEVTDLLQAHTEFRSLLFDNLP
jgi:hypothetical protein